MSTPSSSRYDRIATFGASRISIAVAFLWGFAEATVFFLVPDIFLGFVSIFNWRKGLHLAAATVAGALVGGAVMYGFAANNPPAADKVLTAIPLIDSAMVADVRSQVESGGLSALVTGPLQGIPYKIFAVQSGAQGLPFFQFLLFTILARSERLLPVALLASAFGRFAHKFIRRQTWLVLGIYLALWVGIYIIYFLQFR
jgi:membrane protein YqaA with SNARE-associated domain